MVGYRGQSGEARGQSRGSLFFFFLYEFYQCISEKKKKENPAKPPQSEERLPNLNVTCDHD